MKFSKMQASSALLAIVCLMGSVSVAWNSAAAGSSTPTRKSTTVRKRVVPKVKPRLQRRSPVQRRLGKASIPVFPGAQGFGIDTSAGRGGRILTVTTLAESGPGSLRAALDTPGPRTIVFEVGGTINLGTRNLAIKEPFVTIAGQTAPSPGINIVGAGILVRTHDVLMQHLRVRVGDRSGITFDGISVGETKRGEDEVYNVVVDRCSFAWGVDENASTAGDFQGIPRDVTYSNNIIAEGLSNSVHKEGEHSKGSLVFRGSRNIAFIGNLYAHNRDRNPQLSKDTSSVVVNNLIYNPGFRAISLGSDISYGETVTAIEGNVLIGGLDTEADMGLINLATGPYRASQRDNLAVDRFGKTLPLIRKNKPYTFLGARPIWDSSIDVRPASQVEDWVLRSAGARPSDRDEVDDRIVASVRRGTGRIINSQNDVGGYPSLATARRAVQIPDNPNGDEDGDGYTNLEEWLHSLEP